MSWCDKLASTPAVGVRLDRQYVPVSKLLEPLAPIISGWIERERDQNQHPFTIDQQDLYSCTLTTLDGYSFTLGPEQFAVEFKHRLRFRGRSAGPPTAELLSKPRPYTEVLNDVTEKLLKMIELVTTGHSRKLSRLGLVTTTLVDADEAPPGILRFMKYIEKPWNVELDSMSVETTAKLPKEKGAAHQDRCIHVISEPEDQDSLVTVRLDYQRTFDDIKGINMNSLPGVLAVFQKNALDYFEDIGQGERFDA